jgi:hypothetical protein
MEVFGSFLLKYWIRCLRIDLDRQGVKCLLENSFCRTKGHGRNQSDGCDSSRQDELRQACCCLIYLPRHRRLARFYLGRYLDYLSTYRI